MKALAEGNWLTRDRVSAVAWLSALGGLGMLLFLLLTSQGTIDIFGQPVGTDFTAFRTAGLMANEGNAASAWTPDQLNARVHSVHPGAQFDTAWLYPPVFLLIASPLAALPYLPSLILWQLFSLLVVGATLQAILKDRRATAIALASPLTPMVLAHGQNAFLTAALLGSGLLLLNRSPRTSGILLGALVYKPQLGLLIGPLLLVTRSWRTLIVAGLVAAGLVLSSLALWGFESWKAFAASLGIGRFYMEQGAVGFYKSASLFSAARQWGASIGVAQAIQAVGALAALALIWRVRNSPAGVRNAGVCAATILSTPYLLDYDMALAGLGAAFIYAEARSTGFRSFEKTLLALIWVIPWFSRAAAQHLLLPLGPVTMLLLVWLVLRRSGSEHCHPAVDVQRLSGDVTRFTAREVNRGRADVLA